MKILLVSTDFPYSTDAGSITQGGGGACIAQLAEGLHKKGLEVEVLSRTEPELKSELFDFPIHRTEFYDMGFRESKITHVIPATSACMRLLKQGDFDILHTHNPTAGMTGVACSRQFSIPHILTLHGPWAGVRQKAHTRAIARVIEAATVRKADFVTCDSQALLNEIRTNYGARESKTCCIPNAVDTDFFSPTRATKAKARKELGLATEKPLVFYTGRFVVEKGLPYLLEAFSQIIEENKDIELLLVGGGYDDALLKTWLAKNPKTAEKVHVIPYLPYEKMPYAYLAADFFVLPTLAEGMSRSIMEAMACGKPVIATEVGGNPELIEDGRGMLIPMKDSVAIKEAVTQLLENEAEAGKIVKVSRSFAEKELPVEKRINAFIKTYDLLINNNSILK
jgi:glycosyltransferase involved in cell wall biosynthesis